MNRRYAYATREGFGRLRRTITTFVDQDSKESPYAVVNYKHVEFGPVIGNFSVHQTL